MMYGRWQCVCGEQFSSAHPFRQRWHQWWYGHGDDNYYLVPEGMSASEYRAQVRREIEEQEKRDDLAAYGFWKADTIKAAKILREKFRDVPVSIKMSRETWRIIINAASSVRPSQEPQMHFFGMPIIFDEEIPVGEVKEQLT